MDRVPLPSVAELRAKIEGTLVDVLDMDIVAVADGRVELAMPVTHRHLAPNHYLHGGAVVALADTACGLGSFAHLPLNATGFTTIELKTNFLGTATIGMLGCVATPLHLGRTTQVWDAQVVHHETERTIARFRCTQMVLWPK